MNLKDIDINGIVTENQFKELIPSETFMGTSFTGKRVPLLPHSQSMILTLENRNLFVEAALKQRFEEMAPAAHLIREGICEIVPVPILDLMPINHFETLVAGNFNIQCSGYIKGCSVFMDLCTSHPFLISQNLFLRDLNSRFAFSMENF